MTTGNRQFLLVGPGKKFRERLAPVEDDRWGAARLCSPLLTSRYRLTDPDARSKVRVVAFNTVEEWSRDVTEDIARALLDREAGNADLSESARNFVARVLDTATLW
jgi:hypothetical protein